MISEIPVFHVTLQLLFCVIALMLFAYDTILLMATLSHRNDTNIPFSYIIVMSVSGLLCKIAFITDFVTYLFLPYDVYLINYRPNFGREFTLMGTLTYFIPLCVSVLMTSNRLFIVVICLTLLLIPYFSYCPVNFLASTLVFVTGCAPDRHPVTRFTNLNAIWVPTTLLVINCALVLHLKVSRILQKSSIGALTSSLIVGQKRRESSLARQTVALAIYLSFYEVGSFLMRTFPDPYASLPSYVKDGYFYFRLETICAINFFVYFMENGSTRKMVKKYLNIGANKSKFAYGGRTSGSGAYKMSTISHHLLF